MIFSAFIAVVVLLLTFVIDYLPLSSGFPPEVHTSAIYVGSFFTALDVLLPTIALASAVALAVSVDIAIFSFNNFKWIVSYLPFIGGKK